MLAKHLRIETMNKAGLYSAGEQRWQHATEIRTSYGYVDITQPLIGFRLTRWLYALCWTVLEVILRELFGDAVKADKKSHLRSLKDLDEAAATLASACH